LTDRSRCLLCRFSKFLFFEVLVGCHEHDRVGGDPDEAEARGAGTVENYEQ
jgi:hypothetical protein